MIKQMDLWLQASRSMGCMAISRRTDFFKLNGCK